MVILSKSAWINVYPYYVQQMNDLIGLIKPTLSSDYSRLTNIDFVIDVMVPEVCSNFSHEGIHYCHSSTILTELSLMLLDHP